MNKEKEIEELRTLMFEKSNSQNVEPVFTDENDEEHYLPDEAIKVLNDILEKAFIPFLAEVVINAGYRLCGGEDCPKFKRYQAECERCTKKMEVKKSFEIESAVQRVVKEFAEKLKEKMELNGYRSPLHNRIIDNLITELYGADE